MTKRKAVPTGRHRRWLAALAVWWWLAPSAAQAEIDYQLGRGLDLGPFNIAGYSNVVASLPNQGRKGVALDDLGMFLSGHVSPLFNPFMEAELTHADIVSWGNGRGERNDPDLVVERLYNDINVTDGASFRVGKMLTPVGEWNQIHAAPLVLTTVRPAVTYRNFSEYVSGASVIYNDGELQSPGVQIYGQPNGELSERPNSIAFHQYKQVYGGHLNYPITLLDQIGFSYQGSIDTQNQHQSLFGLDGRYSVGKVSLWSEATISRLSNTPAGLATSTEWGAYAAASYALNEKWSVYAWYEGFRERTASSAAQDFLIGASYRPHPAVVLKLEFLQNVGGAPVNPTGLFASWSVLF